MTDSPHTGRAAFWRYVLVGVFSFTVNLGLAFTFHKMLGISENMAPALSLAVVFVMNFILARKFIYRDPGRWQVQFVRFGAVSASARLSEYALFLFLNAAGLNYLLALATAQGISFMAKFFLYGRFAFNGKAVALGRVMRSHVHPRQRRVLPPERTSANPEPARSAAGGLVTGIRCGLRRFLSRSIPPV